MFIQGIILLIELSLFILDLKFLALQKHLILFIYDTV